MISKVNGDLILAFKNNTIDTMGHGNNCFHTMTKGIARSISGQYPEAFEADLAHGQKGDMNRLGDFSFVVVNRDGINGIIYNIYSQFNFGRIYGIPIDYTALEKGLYKIKEHMLSNLELLDSKRERKILGLPKIGCGLAGGSWEKVEPIIENVFLSSIIDVIIFHYDENKGGEKQ